MAGEHAAFYACAMESTTDIRPVRILLIGFRAAFARSLTRYVSSDGRVALTAIAAGLGEAGTLLPVTRANLALLDWSVLDRSPRKVFQALRQVCPDLCIVCVVNEALAYHDVALRAGADGVISKEAFAEELEPLLLRLSTQAGASEAATCGSSLKVTENGCDGKIA